MENIAKKRQVFVLSQLLVACTSRKCLRAKESQPKCTPLLCSVVSPTTM